MAEGHFEGENMDGKILCECDTKWYEMSCQEVAEHPEGPKTINVCTEDLYTLTVFHGDLETTIELNDGERAYYAIKGETTFFPDGTKIDRITGRIVGKVKDGIIIEERHLDALTNSIIGFQV